jgi:hypothetical protein
MGRRRCLPKRFEWGTAIDSEPPNSSLVFRSLHGTVSPVICPLSPRLLRRLPTLDPVKIVHDSYSAVDAMRPWRLALNACEFMLGFLRTESAAVAG